MRSLSISCTSEPEAILNGGVMLLSKQNNVDVSFYRDQALRIEKNFLIGTTFISTNELIHPEFSLNELSSSEYVVI